MADATIIALFFSLFFFLNNDNKSPMQQERNALTQQKERNVSKHSRKLLNYIGRDSCQNLIATTWLFVESAVYGSSNENAQDLCLQ